MTDEPVEVPESLEVKSQMISEYAASLGVELHPDWAALTIEKLQRKLADVQEHNLADAKIADLADVIDDAVQRVVAKLTTPPPNDGLLEKVYSVMDRQTDILQTIANYGLVERLPQPQNVVDEYPIETVHEKVSTDNIVDSSVSRPQAKRKVSTKVSTDSKNGQSTDSNVDKILQYQLRHSGASVRTTADDLKLKKSQVGEIIKQLRQDGLL